MFITQRYSRYNRDDEQSAAGLFLIVFDDDSAGQVEYQPGKFAAPLLACIRDVRMTQLGHFMMARTRIGPHRVTLSGAYGGDGLPAHFAERNIPDDARPFLHEIPTALAATFWNGGGHNTTGSEAPALREWAKGHITELRAKRRTP